MIFGEAFYRLIYLIAGIILFIIFFKHFQKVYDKCYRKMEDSGMAFFRCCRGENKEKCKHCPYYYEETK